MLGYEGILESLFALLVCVMFFFWVSAKYSKRTFWEHYNICLDNLFGKTEEIKMENPLKKFKGKIR